MKKKKKGKRENDHNTRDPFAVFLGRQIGQPPREKERSLTVEEHANGRELQEDPPRNRGLSAITENKQRQSRAFCCGFRSVSPGMKSRRGIESR